MSRFLSFRIRLAEARVEPNGRSRRAKALLRLLGTGLATLALSRILPIPTAFGQTYSYSGYLTATINVAPMVKGLSISTNAVSFGNCYKADHTTATPSGLTLPNGACDTHVTPVTVTNGGASATILITGSNAIPGDNGIHWTLQSTTTPGNDQFYLANSLNSSLPTFTPSTVLGTSGVGDLAFGGGGAAGPGQLENETLEIIGPATSTDQSPTFTTQVTWTAT